MHGVTVYDRSALLLKAQQLAQTQDTPYLAALAHHVRQVYHQDGWFLAEVRTFIDPSSGRSGIVVEEGHLRALEVVGVREDIGKRVASHFNALRQSNPIHLAAFERSLMLAGDLGGVSLRAELIADTQGPGYRAVLHATQRESVVSTQVDSVPRSSALSVYTSAETSSLLSPGDLMRVVAGINTRTNGREHGIQGGLFYRMPVGNNGLYAEAYVSQLNQTLETVRPTIEQRQQKGALAGVLVGYPIWRSIDRALYTMMAAERRDADAAEAPRLVDRSNAVRFSAYYTEANTESPAIRTGLTLSVGNAKSSQNQFVDRQFWHLRAVAGKVFSVGTPQAGYALRLEGYAKVSSRTLPDVERLVLGDRDRMRGYMLGAASGDSGAIGTIELSRRFLLGTEAVRAITPSVFLDFGTVRRNRSSSGTVAGIEQARTVNLASVGVASHFHMPGGFSVGGWVGLPLLDGGTGVKHKPAAYLRLNKTW